MTNKLPCRAPWVAPARHGPRHSHGRVIRVAAASAGLLMLSSAYAGAQTQTPSLNLFQLFSGSQSKPIEHGPVADPNAPPAATAETVAAPAMAKKKAVRRGLVFRNGKGGVRKKAAAKKVVLTALGTSPTPIQSKDTIDAIRTSIQRYQAISQAGGWGVVPEGKSPRKGSRGAIVTALAKRLSMTKDLEGQISKSPAFDNAMIAALKRFQVRYGLPPTGVLDETTRAEMNVDVTTRITQLGINLKRLAKLTRGKMPQRFVMVNIPGYELQAVTDGNVDMRQRVVLGRPSRKTPVLQTKITQLNFLPYWHAPQGIVRRDLIPILKKSTEYLRTSNMKVYKVFGGKEIDPETVDWSSPEAAKLKFRQEPGPRNALGYLRLSMSNRYAVFLHDTPQKNLFLDDVRAFSSGCVRVQNIPVFAEWLAKNNTGWDQARILETFEAGKRKDLTLRKAVPVYFSYITAWATPEGTVQFRRDIYKKDGLLQLASVEVKKDDSITP